MSDLAKPRDDFTQRVDVETPELVVLSYTVAGIGSRVYAGFIDLLIIFALLIGVGVASAMVRSRFGVSLGLGGTAVIAFLGLVSFAIFWGYYVICEWAFDGQTFGKWRLGLRVVRDGGYSVGFAASAVRNLVRIIDMQPGAFYLLGIGSVVLTKTGKRIGDIAAGTIVIQEKLVDAPAAEKRAPAVAPFTTAPVATLTEDDFRLVERWYARRLDIDPERRKALTEQIAARVAAFLPGGASVPAPTRLAELYANERRARDAGAAARNETGAARERYAIVSTSSPRWLAFAATVATAQKSGLKSLGEVKVREFVTEYRALSNDLARLKTASRDAEADELFYLGRLVGSAHNLLYKEGGITLAAFLRFMFGEVPREVRHSFRPIALAAVLLFLPGVIAGTAVIRNPAVASVFIPPGMLDRANEGVKRSADGSGYIEDPQIFRPLMASGIIRNNIQVTFVVFAMGIPAGLGTALMLVLNGVSLGGVIGLYQSKGILPLLVAFVAPHGVLELSAVCIAGGAGFLLAAALILPGRRTRRAAFVENGRRAMKLIAASTLLLLIAGLLEGLVSPIPYWPLQWKLTVSAVTALLLYIFLRGGLPPRVPTAKAEDFEADLLGLGA